MTQAEDDMADPAIAELEAILGSLEVSGGVLLGRAAETPASISELPGAHPPGIGTRCPGDGEREGRPVAEGFCREHGGRRQARSRRGAGRDHH